jgi:uncharacterized membrane protein
VTVLAVCGWGSASLGRFGVVAVRVLILRIRMALGADNLFGCRLVDQAFYVCVAIHTGEHAAVNRVLQLVRIDLQAYRLAVNLIRQSGVGVASKTIAVFELLFGASCTRACKQR